MFDTISTIISYLSYLIILKIIVQLGWFIYKRFRPRKDHLAKYGRGSWALVTGGSDGIGKAISEELAKIGFNILLVARTESKLSAISKEIESKFSVLTDYIVFDFNNKDQTYAHYENIFNEQFNRREISILVNNVGTADLSRIIDMDETRIIKTINMNCYPQLYLSKMFVEKRQEKGAIINLSSLMAESIAGHGNVYNATKRFNDYFSKGLAYENPCLDIISVRPSGVATPLSKFKEGQFGIVTAEQCAKSIIDDLGYETETNGHILHTIQAYIVGLLPEYLNYYFGDKVAKKHLEATRQEREQEQLVQQ